MTTQLITPAEDQLQDFCLRWKIKELALFGSILRDDFSSDSDVDMLVTFQGDNTWSLLDLVQAEEELSKIVGIPVDLVERSVVEQSENWIRRDSILSRTKTIYAQ